MKVALQCVELACHRAANDVHRRMQRGFGGLAAVAATAAWLGLMGTCIGIVGSFRGITGDKTSIMAATAGSLGDSLIPAAAGVLIAISASCGHRYLRARLEGFDTEMRNATLDLVNHLVGWASGPPSAGRRPAPPPH